MTKTQRFLLPREARATGKRCILFQPCEISIAAALLKCRIQFKDVIEMIFDRAFAASGDKDEMFNTRRARFFNNMLNDRLIDDRQHFFRDRFRGGQKPRAETSDGEDGLADWFHA
jgi:hypothetical protein